MLLSLSEDIGIVWTSPLSRSILHTTWGCRIRVFLFFEFPEDLELDFELDLDVIPRYFMCSCERPPMWYMTSPTFKSSVFTFSI